MDPISVKNGVLAVVAVVGSLIANALGGLDTAMVLLVALMASDYLTGVLLGVLWKSPKSESGGLDSKAGFQGLCKKGVILLLVWVACLLDDAIGGNYIRMAVILFFVGNEGLSLLENLGLMGVPYPAFLQRTLEALKDTGDQGKGDKQ